MRPFNCFSFAFWIGRIYCRLLGLLKSCLPVVNLTRFLPFCVKTENWDWLFFNYLFDRNCQLHRVHFHAPHFLLVNLTTTPGLTLWNWSHEWMRVGSIWPGCLFRVFCSQMCQLRLFSPDCLNSYLVLFDLTRRQNFLHHWHATLQDRSSLVFYLLFLANQLRSGATF